MSSPTEPEARRGGRWSAGRGRRVLTRTLVAAASVASVLALVSAYVERAAVNSDQFANRATAALEDDSVRTLAAEKITDEVVLKNRADLIAVRPIIQSVASGLVGSTAFTGLFRSSVRDVHRSVFDHDRDTVTLTIADAGTVVAAGLRKLRPATADKVESTGKVTLLRRDIGSASGDLARAGERIHVLAVLLLIAALGLAAAALAVSPHRRGTVVHLGVGVAIGAVLLVVAYGVGRSVALGHIEQPEGRAAAGAVWDAFLGDLRTAAWILAGAGAVIAATAASVIRAVDIDGPLRRLARLVVEEPRRPVLRAVRGVGLLLAGLILLLRPDAVLQLALTLTGVYLIYAGFSALLRLIPEPAAPPAGARRSVSHLRSPRRLASTGIAVAVIAGAIAIFVGSGGTTTAAPPPGPCNGDSRLCDRPLSRVALPATHNSMSVPLPGWYSAEQEHPIADQLADGIRGLLIDTHYADKLSDGKLRTYFGSPEDLRRQAKQDGVSPDAVDAAERIRERIGFSGEGERGSYLCHGFCELGGTPLDSVLDDIHDFLVANPGEVLVIVNQDYVTPEDFVAAVRDAGLGDLVYSPPASGAWPTLREMIDRNQRVVFLAENHAGAAPWYQLAYDGITEETPYAFSKVPQLTDRAELPASCKPNRGGTHAPLFLVNHWISTDPIPLPSNAAKVNAYDPLLRRARECRDRRDHLPNLVAVNFYRQGDLFRVVDALNGLR